MASLVLVVGAGPDALLAAAVASAMGFRVNCALAEPYAAALRNPDIPRDLGHVGDVPIDPAIAKALGGFVKLQHDSPTSGRAVFHNGRLRPLPLRPRDLCRLLEPSLAAQVLWGLTRARLADELGDLLGTWREIRSYRDWVCTQFGEPIFDLLHSHYCARRWGSPFDMSASVARLHHGCPSSGTLLTPRLPPRDFLKRQVELVEASGGGLYLNSPLRSFLLEDGQVVGAYLVGRTEPLLGRVLAAIPPAAVLKALDPTAAKALGADVGHLKARHSVQVMVPVKSDHLPREIHLMDPGIPFFRILRPAALPACGQLAGCLVLHANIDEADPLWTEDDQHWGELARQSLADSGLAVPTGGNTRVNRLRNHEAQWTMGWHPTWMKATETYQEIGLAGTGRSGSFAPISPSREIALTVSVLSEDIVGLRDTYRSHVDPPTATERRSVSIMDIVVA